MEIEQDLKEATLEAIYWWNRDEDYYHKLFSNFNKIYENKALLAFFTQKIFEVFLRQYSIRRNLSAGYKNVDVFIDELFEYDFLNEVCIGNIDIIDSLSNKIKQNEKSTKNHIKSLLSKIAFLINPNDFSLYDSLSKNSLWELIKTKKNIQQNSLNDYSIFISETDKLIQLNDELIYKQREVLKTFSGTPAFHFFSNNPKAFSRRVFDKYLWLRQQSTNSASRPILNEVYINLLTEFGTIH